MEIDQIVQHQDYKMQKKVCPACGNTIRTDVEQTCGVCEECR